MNGADLAAVTTAGLLGFDPIGAVVALAALAMGANRRGMFILLVAYLVAIAALGSVASFGYRVGLHALDPARFVPPLRVLSYLEVSVGVVLLLTSLLFARRGRTRQTESAPRWVSATPAGLAVAGVAVAGSLLVDPGFLVMVGLWASRSPLTYPLAFAYWGLWSQLLMVGVCAAVAVGPGRRIVAALSRVVATLSSHSQRIITTILALAGLGMVLDGAHRLGALALVGLP